MQEIDAHKIISSPRTSSAYFEFITCHIMTIPEKKQGNNTQQSDKTYPSRNNGPYIYIIITIIIITMNNNNK
jgi:hypothetical protein